MAAAVVDASTFVGKHMMGYQGWFGCPGDGSSGQSCHAGRNWSMPLPTFMSFTRTPEGNWSAPVAVPKVQQAPLIDSNLSPIIFKNGSLLGLWRNDDDRGSIHTATAADWRDPETYVQHTYDIFSRGGLPALNAGLEGVEDPYAHAPACPCTSTK